MHPHHHHQVHVSTCDGASLATTSHPVFCGGSLDFGATVVSVARVGQPFVDTLSRNKRSLAVNLKDKRGIGIVTKLSSKVRVCACACMCVCVCVCVCVCACMCVCVCMCIPTCTCVHIY